MYKEVRQTQNFS